MGQWVRLEPKPVLVQEVLRLAPFMEVLMKVGENGTTLVQEENATVEDDTMAE